MFIASFLHGLMIRKDNCGPGLKHCWTNNCILMAPDKGLALGFGKDLLLLLEIVWTVHFIWASAIKNYLYPPKGTNHNYLHCWDKTSGSAVTGQGVTSSNSKRGNLGWTLERNSSQCVILWQRHLREGRSAAGLCWALSPGWGH